MTEYRHYDFSAWLARRAVEVADGDEPAVEHVVLPGAKEAIAHARLVAYQERGMGEHEIVDRLNARWRERNAARLAEHARWLAGPYQAALQAPRERGE